MYQLTMNGELPKDFTYSSYAKLYKKSVSKSVSKSKVDVVDDCAKKGQRSESTEHAGHKQLPPKIADNSAQERKPLQPMYSYNTIVQPVSISPLRKIACVLGCVGISLLTIIVCIVAYKLTLPLILITLAVLIAIVAIIIIPKLDLEGAYNMIVEFPEYITVKCKDKKKTLYVIVPKVRVRFFTFLSLSVMIALCVATLFGNAKGIIWPWISFSLLSVFNTFYLTEKRTLWTKSVLGIILGVFSILTIILEIALFVRVLSRLFPL